MEKLESERVIDLLKTGLALAALAQAANAADLSLNAPHPIPTGQYRELTAVGDAVLSRDGSGVGIGTADPQASVHVIAPTAGARLQTAGAGSWEMRTFDNSGSKAWALRDVEAAADRLQIDAAGNIGIGTPPDPASSLAVESAHGINLIGAATTDIIFTPIPASPNVVRWRTGTIGDDYAIRAEPAGGGNPFGLWIHKNGNTYIGEWAGPGTPNTGFPFSADNGAFLDLTGTFSSSRRAGKTDIRPLDLPEAERILSGLRPVRFRYKAEPDEESIGFVAEETPEPVAPVTRDGINADALAATLTRIVQDRQRALEELEREIERLRR